MSNSPCVLVIDDDDAIRQLICVLLADEGYEGISLADDHAALEYAATHRPHLILLDSVARGVDHTAFVHAYRALPGPHAPIYLFTAAANARERARALDVDGIVTKPFDIDHLLNLARRLAQTAEAS